jgi:antitoxin MazE
MKANIVRIGNSQGLRLPKAVLEQTGLSGEVELEVDGSRLIIRSPKRTRAGWGEAFQAMRAHGEDALLDGDAAAVTAWDEAEWQW